jgi:hypothetical protein
MFLKITVDTKKENFNEISNLMTKLSQYVEEGYCDYEIKAYGYKISFPNPAKNKEKTEEINAIFSKLMKLAEKWELF